jgi:hypothetical protein
MIHLQIDKEMKQRGETDRQTDTKLKLQFS